MMDYSFGNRSKRNLSTCHHDLRKIFNLAITRTQIDFGISEGFRSIQRQKQLYEEGRSKIDGVTRLGKHNLEPSEAVDIYIYHPDAEIRQKLAYDKGSLCYLAGVINSCAVELFENNETTHLIRWGGNWDNDGVILHDQSFDDLPHFELL